MFDPIDCVTELLQVDSLFNRLSLTLRKSTNKVIFKFFPTQYPTNFQLTELYWTHLDAVADGYYGNVIFPTYDLLYSNYGVIYLIMVLYIVDRVVDQPTNKADIGVSLSRPLNIF